MDLFVEEEKGDLNSNDQRLVVYSYEISFGRGSLGMNLQNCLSGKGLQNEFAQFFKMIFKRRCSLIKKIICVYIL